MEMKRIREEDILDKRTNPLTEEEINILIDRYKAKTLMLATLMVLGSDYWCKPDAPTTEVDAAVPYTRNLLIQEVLANHKKGTLSVIGPESCFIVDGRIQEDVKKIERLIGKPKEASALKALENELINYSNLLSECFIANRQIKREYGPFALTCAKWLSSQDFKKILADPELEDLVKGQMFFTYLSKNVFQKKERPTIRGAYYYHTLAVSPEDEKSYVSAVKNQMQDPFLFRLLEEMAKDGQIEALKYMKELFPEEVSRLHIRSKQDITGYIHPSLYHYEKDNDEYARELFILCNNSPVISERVMYFLLAQKKYGELLQVMSTDTFHVNLHPSVLSTIASYIPSDEYYISRDGKKQGEIAITDELTARIAEVLRNKPGIKNDEEKQAMLDEFQEDTRREGMYEQERELRAGQAAVVQTFGAVYRKVEDIVPMKHRVRELPYYTNKRG